MPDVSKAVIIVAPHTSNWDFFVGLSIDLVLDLKASFLGKHSLFVWPVKGLLEWIGGIPVRRGAGENVVDQMVAEFARRDELLLAIAPEGTRRKVAEWHKGFWHIARAAKVPIILVSLDYGRRVVTLGPTITPTNDLESDLRMLKAHFAKVTPRHPHLF
ncbi:MAG: 1-acyl-sn-glycerol-3-phosphate acyltransferase [Gemmatimonadaceae bacterium]